MTFNDFLLTQHFAELGIVQVRVLDREPFAFIFGPDHERVHGPSDPRLRSLVRRSPVRAVSVGRVPVSWRTLEGLRPWRVRADEGCHLRAPNLRCASHTLCDNLRSFSGGDEDSLKSWKNYRNSFTFIQRCLDTHNYRLQSDVLGQTADALGLRLLLVSYDSVFPGGKRERFIFEEQVPGETPQDSRLLLDCKLSPVKGKRARAAFQHNQLLETTQ